MPALRLAAVAVILSLAGAAPLIAQPAATPASARTITLTSYAFAPAALRLAAGQPVTLNFVNQAGKGHDFTAPEFFAHARILSGSAPRGRIALEGGASAAVTLVPAAGTYAAHCSHFLHSSLGMTGTIIVQ